MKWEDVSKHLPGRSAISCRLHYHLEKRGEWDEERKNKLANLYERYVFVFISSIAYILSMWLRRNFASSSRQFAPVSTNAPPRLQTSRLKPDMWSKVAEELAVPWRAVEAMHWQLGEAEMARRAGVMPFKLTASNVDSGPRNASQPSVRYPIAPIARHRGQQVDFLAL
jgi:hypothetical protein